MVEGIYEDIMVIYMTSQRDDVYDVPFFEPHFPAHLEHQLRMEVRHTRITDLSGDRVRAVERTD
jgi:hypothetical protein